MTQLTKNLKKKKGFTLVEVIIVLVILAILAAILIPSLVGYIDKANEKASIATCRSFVMAAQTIGSETYGEHGSLSTYVSTKTEAGKTISTTDFMDQIVKLSEVPDNCKAAITMTPKGKITNVTFDDGSYLVTFDGSKYSVASTYKELTSTEATVTIKAES